MRESQIVHLPQRRRHEGRILGRTVDDKPVDGTLQVNAVRAITTPTSGTTAVGRGRDCASGSASEYNPAVDTTVITIASGL